ncbi:Hypothetical predicted protein [Octopus vulgaris]|uniref:Uncharacterized protein n=1 Tax=Octopus vulgaris TaxID=6645 RepID=A0AA36BUW3_OCTVU|nr:Hypothetical predicted protein [Octopus vulgaris]
MGNAETRISKNFFLDGLQTNSKGFLVLSANDSNENSKEIKEALREFQNVAFNITLIHHVPIHTIIRRSFQTNVVICYEDVAPIQLASNVSTEGSVNNCPLSPVHIEQVSLLNDSTLAVVLHSNGLPKWNLKSLVVSVTLNGNSTHNISLDGVTTNENETYSLNISVNPTQEQTVAVLLNLVSNTSGPIILDGAAFGNGNKPSENLTKIWTYPYLYPPKEQAIPYFELNSNSTSMVKFCRCNLLSKFFAASELKNCSSLCYDSQVPGNTSLPNTKLPPTSTSSPGSSTAPSSSSSPSTSLDATMTTEAFPSTSSANSSLEEVNTTMSSTSNSSVITTTPDGTTSMSVPNTTVAFNNTTTPSIQNTTTSNGSTVTYVTSTSYDTTDSEETTTSYDNSTDSMETTTSDFTDVTSPEISPTNSTTAETPHYPSTPSSPPSSTQATTKTPGTVQRDVLKINEISLSHNEGKSPWVELKNKNSSSSSKYSLVWSPINRKFNSSITINNLITQNQSLIIIDKEKNEYNEFLERLHTRSGILELHHADSNQLVDCVSYMISNVPVTKKTKDLMHSECSMHPPVFITAKEISADWTINFCGENHFQVAGPSYNTLENLCPSTRNIPLSMVMLNVKKTEDFKLQLTYEFVLSNVTTSPKDKSHTLVTIILYGHNASHLQTLYKGYKSLFTPDSTVFQINEKSITVYRESTIVGTLTKKDNSNTTVTIAVLLSLLVVFVFIVVSVCLYMKYKRKNLTNLFSKLYFRSDQDDLLVNMEDVNTQESHFNNPYYNQLSV